MMLSHLESLFEFYETIDDLEEWFFEDDILFSYVKHHFEIKKAVKSITKELKDT